MNLTVNGIRYHVNVHRQDAQKKNLIMLHGFMGSGRGFASLIAHLSPFCNPVTIDLLGHGKTEGAGEAQRFSANHQVEDLQQIIFHISKGNPFLHGYSMGGRLALRYALTYPKSIGGLILESTHYGLEDETNIRQRRQIDEERSASIEHDYTTFVKDWQKLPIFQNGIALPPQKTNPYHNIQKKQNPEQMAYSLRGFGAAEMPSVKEQLAELKMSVLLLAGQADLKYAEIAQRMHKKISDSSLSIIPNAGHRVHLEHPKAFIKAIETFLKNEY